MLKTFTALTRRLAGDRRGGALIVFALLLPVLALLAVGSIDLYRSAVVRQELQASLDAAALMAARSQGTTDEAVQAAGYAAFVGEFKSREGKQPMAHFKLGPNNTVIADANAKVEPLILGMLGKTFMVSSVQTVVKRSQGTPIELVLVLDTTNSMSGQPIKDLKVAAADLVTKLHNNAVPGHLKIGVVPFAQHVNIGVSRRNMSWVSVPADYSVTTPAPNPPQCTTTTTKTTCTTQKYDCVVDGVMRPNGCSKSVNCKTTAITPVTTCKGPSTANYKFYGCVGSPVYPGNVEDSNSARVYPGFLNLQCGSEITPLTTDKTKVLGAINGLATKDFTYIPSGLAWGFNMLSAAQPLTDAAAYDKTGENKQPRKALVLMTDGANTILMNPTTRRHDKKPAGASPAKQADDYTEELCKNIKAQKIEVFTIAFQVNDAKAKKLVESCATDAEHYYDAADAKKLQAAFAAIADSLRNLYIAK